MIGQEATLSSARTGKGRDCWQTPNKVLDPVREFAGGKIWLDVATAKNNPVDAAWFYTEERNGLELPWQIAAHEVATGRRVDGVTWANPPYSNSKAWIAKAVEEARTGAEIVMLIASRTGAKYFAPCFRADALCFYSGRITFNDSDTGLPVLDKHKRPMPAPFDSVLVYWGNRSGRFRRKVGHLGEVVIPLRGQR